MTPLALATGGAIPNNPLPALVARSALDAPGADAVMALFSANGWQGLWEYTVFDFHHFHPNVHEVLAVVEGRARLILGGPGGETLDVGPGDVLLLPPGTGHCRDAAGDGFSVVGGYPPGAGPVETLRALPDDGGATLRRIAEVPRPAADPLYGAGRPLLAAWG
ncbi:cupin domain-containing protein [Oceaniglobus roseus]|uniref:cupin domain-containing protein n=1 Tax=Oceaniglobus roseus TaxID=1737570 RepID=UPI001FEA3DF7|nr:cupin domain-containing protein [Kandeliimicrobium roseum]